MQRTPFYLHILFPLPFYLPYGLIQNLKIFLTLDFSLTSSLICKYFKTFFITEKLHLITFYINFIKKMSSSSESEFEKDEIEEFFREN